MSAIQPLSYAHTPQTRAKIYSTISEKIEEHARNQPEKEAFVFYGPDGTRESVTCLQLYNKSEEFGRGLKNIGVVKGDIIGIALPNSLEWLVATFGSQIAGAQALCVNMDSDESFLGVFQKAGKFKVVITDAGEDDTKKNILNRIMQNEYGNVPKPEYIIFTDAERFTSYEMDFKSIPKSQDELSDDMEFPPISCDDVALILRTSGSTGVSKLVQISHRYVLAHGQYQREMMKLTSDDVFYNPNSFGWGGGLCASFLVVGSAHVTCDHRLLNSQRDIGHFTQSLLKRESCTVSIMIPQLVLKLLDTDNKHDNFKKLRVILTGCDPVPLKCCEVLGRYTDNFVNSYGSTELSHVLYTSVSKPVDFESYLAGRPMTGKEVKVVDEEGKTVHAGVVGELYVRKPVIFSGYLNDPEKTKALYADEGWIKTGDAGYMKEDGNFVIHGRK